MSSAVKSESLHATKGWLWCQWLLTSRALEMNNEGSNQDFSGLCKKKKKQNIRALPSIKIGHVIKILLRFYSGFDQGSFVLSGCSAASSEFTKRINKHFGQLGVLSIQISPLLITQGCLIVDREQ